MKPGETVIYTRKGTYHVSPQMDNVVGTTGTVAYVKDPEHVVVRFVNGETWTVHPDDIEYPLLIVTTV